MNEANTTELAEIKNEINEIEATLCTIRDENFLTRYEQVLLELMKPVIARDTEGKLSPQNCAIQAGIYATAYFDELAAQKEKYFA